MFIAGRRRGMTATIRRELKRRSAIEPVIGHMKTDGRLDRNFLAGAQGDAVNALLCGAGYNLRLILNWLRRWLRGLLQLFAVSYILTRWCSQTSYGSQTRPEVRRKWIFQGRLKQIAAALRVRRRGARRGTADGARISLSRRAECRSNFRMR